MTNKKQKGWLLPVFALILATMVCLLSACMDIEPTKEPKSDGSEIGSSSTNAETSKDNIFSLNETAVFDNIKVTATETKESNGTEFFKPESGNIFVGVKFTIENISSEDQSISSLLLFDAYCDGVKCDYSFKANSVINEGSLDGTLSPGKKMIGYYAIEASKDWKQISFEVKSDWMSNSKAGFVIEK